MYRIVLTSVVRSTSSFRSYAGKLQVLNGAVWEDDADAGSIYAHWYVRGKARSSLPPSEFSEANANLLYDDAVLPVVGMPDVIELDATAIDTLKLRISAVVAIHDQTTGQKIRPPVVYPDTHFVTVALTGLSGRHRLSLTSKCGTPVSIGLLTAGVLTIPGKQMIIGNVIAGNVAYDWVSVSYVGNNTLVDFGAAYASVGEVLHCPALIKSVHVATGDDSITASLEAPTELIIDDGVLDATAAVLLLQGTTRISFTSDPTECSVLMQQTMQPYLTPGVGVDSGRGGVSASDDSQSVNTNSDGALKSRPGLTTAHRVYAYIEGVWQLADPDLPSVATCELWIALGANSAVNGMSVDAEVYDATWNWATIDGAMYLAANGTMTQTVPNAGTNPGQAARIVGYARSGQRVRFRGYLPGGRLITPVS